MALYRLGDQTYKNLKYPDEIWRGKTDISYLLPEPWPELCRVSSKSENSLYIWFFGKFVVEGSGTVQVNYPYESEPRQHVLDVKNVNLAEIPFMRVEAVGKNFRGWFDFQENLLWKWPVLIIDQWIFPDVTTFYAKFGE